MYNSGNYPDLLEPGLTRKRRKKRLARGELKMYDEDRAAKASNAADTELNRLVTKRTGIDPFRKKRR